MLSPIHSQVRNRRIAAYDLEWYPETLELRTIGVHDERGFRSYRSVPSFLDRELKRANTGRSYYAHYGGKFDIQFLLPDLARRPRLNVSAGFSGSSAVVVRVKRDRHNKWSFGDSGFLLHNALAKIARMVGMRKGECAFDAPLAELESYNQHDCTILYEALQVLRRELELLGGEMRATLASSAMNLFRRVYLKRRIQTDERLNDAIRASYCSSRVEVFAPRCDVGEYYDINSSFPFSMTAPLPGEFRGVTRRQPTGDACWFVEAKVHVPRNIEIPPLFFRHEGRNFFPTGTWEGMFSAPDIELLEQAGGRVEKAYLYRVFEPFQDLADFVADIYNKRKAEVAKKHANEEARTLGLLEPYPGADAREYILKILLNSLYGKFAERAEKDSLVLNPESISCPHGGKHPDDSCMTYVAPRIYRRTDVRKVPHAHVPISAYITAMSRATLWRGLNEVRRRYYTDTDSVVCGAGEGPVNRGTELGQWKHEGTIRDGLFVCAKVYAFEKEGRREIRAKGYRGLSYDEFLSLREGGRVPVHRMAGVREGLREAELGPSWSKVTEKCLRADTMPKRAPDGEGTRPWSVDELRAA